ncbi:mRNA-capping enzyme subunit beta [Podila epigama]|nr:mRNA-capping enzyme subunit beta [Podila epigama]
MSEADINTRKRPFEETEQPSGHDSDLATHSNEERQPNKKTRPEDATQSEETAPSNTTPAVVVANPSSSSSSSSSSASASKSNYPAQSSQSQQQQQQKPQQPPTGQPPRRDHAFFGTDVMDDVVRAVGEFLFQHCHHPNVEIEAKLGVLTDNSTGRRIELPVLSETVIMPQRPAWYRFVSDMTIGYQIQYKHTKEIDQFFTGPQGKTRVTKDQSTNQVVPNGIVKKDRIADLDVYSPRLPFDFRVSVNIEVPVPPPTGNPQFERHKDRISYRHHNFKIDLTQVKTANTPPPHQQQQRPNYSQMARPPPQPDMTHELEIEFVHPEELVRERNIRLNPMPGQRPDRFWEIVGYFINNVRGLANSKYVPPAQRQQQQQQQPQFVNGQRR